MSIIYAASGDTGGHWAPSGVGGWAPRLPRHGDDDLEALFASLAYLTDGAPTSAAADRISAALPNAALPNAALPSAPRARQSALVLPVLRRRPTRTLPPPHPPVSPWALAPAVAPAPPVDASAAPPPMRHRRGLVSALLFASACIAAFLLLASTPRTEVARTPGSSNALVAVPTESPVSAEPQVAPRADAAEIQASAPLSAPVMTAPRAAPRPLTARRHRTIPTPAPEASPATLPPTARETTVKRNSGRLFGTEE